MRHPHARLVPPSKALAQKRAALVLSIAAVAPVAPTALKAQPVFSSDATINSSASFAEDIAITNAASVDVVSGGQLSIGDNEVFVGGTEFAGGTGTLDLGGGGSVSNRTGHIGYLPGSTGTATVSGAGSTWTNTGSLFVGRDGSGSLAIQNGGAVTSLVGAIGYGAGSSGQVNLSGVGSAWTSSNAMLIGRAGTGSLTLEAGATGGSSSLDLGSQATGHGTLTLQGAGTSWTTQSATVGAGALALSGGATLSTSSLPSSIGSRAGASATALVTGAGSAWTAHNLYVGSYGQGGLTINEGATVSSAFGFLGIFSGSEGAVTVTGPGSAWSNPSQVVVAYEGTGTITVADGGRLAFDEEASSITLADQATGVGTLNVGAAASDEAAAPGVIGAAVVNVGAGVGTLQFNTTGTAAQPAYFTRDGSSTGAGVDTAAGLKLVHTAGHTVFTGELAHTGATEINGGTFVLHGSLGDSEVTVDSGATLDGTGVVGGTVTTTNGAHLGSDASLGTLTFADGLFLADGVSLDLELGGGGDLLRVSGGTLSAGIGATILLNIGDAGDFAGGTYTFLDASGASLESIGATSFEIGAFIGGYTYRIVQAGDLFQIVASPVPEPATWATLAGAACLAATTARRKRQGRVGNS